MSQIHVLNAVAAVCGAIAFVLSLFAGSMWLAAINLCFSILNARLALRRPPLT